MSVCDLGHKVGEYCEFQLDYFKIERDMSKIVPQRIPVHPGYTAKVKDMMDGRYVDFDDHCC